MSAERDAVPDWLTTYRAEGVAPWPFCEDGDANIHGYGHQDRAEFAAEVTRWDIEQGAIDSEEDGHSAGEVAHRWAVLDPDGERFWVVTGPEDARVPVTPETPGAFPITCIWGQR